MDVAKPRVKKHRLNLRFIIAGIIVVMAVLAFYRQSGGTVVSVNRGDILVGEVKQGDLDVAIEGFGQLRSEKQQLVTALTAATVKEIVLKPGATVKADSVIVRLENPELNQQLQSDTQELALMKANLRQLKLNQKREALNEQANVAALEAQYQTAKLQREAEQTLVENGIVSQLTYKESVLNEQQLKRQLELLQVRQQQLSEVHREAVIIEQERIKQYQGQLAISQERLDRLVVRAGFDGVLQRLSVELGQSLSPGQEIGLIGGVDELIALVRVPQSQAQQVELGQKAIIDTRRDKIIGQVVRIDPVVVDNTVSIEVALPDNLPQSARPQLNVDGTIIAKTLKNVMYIERPANTQANSQVQLFKLEDNQEVAKLQSVQFGVRAGRYIEIRSGVSTRDRFIVSDTSQLSNTASELSIQL